MSALKGVKAVLFDMYDTLVWIRTDEERLETYEKVSSWLHYQGVDIPPAALKKEYRLRIRERMNVSGERYPEVRVEEIFSEICHDHRLWGVDEETLGRETARAFRAASLLQIRAIPQSVCLLTYLGDIQKGIVSNGQRVFSELELKYLGLYGFFTMVLFSSDVGVKKPDPRIFRAALDRMNLKPDETLFIGESDECDIVPAQSLGMKALIIQQAWNLVDQ